MQPTDKSGPPSVSEPESTPAAGPVVVSSDSLDSLGGPASDPSDPDAAMYAAIAARPDWTTKPAARAALAELSQGLTTGQDLLFWDVHRPRDAKPSDAAEHASIAVPHQAAGQGAAGVELPSRRLYVGPAADPRRVATVRSPGRNGPRRPSAAGAEVTLVSRCGGAEGSAAEGRLPALHGDGSRVRVVRGAVATLVGSLAVALGLLGLFGVPASGPAAPLDASVSARPSSDKQAGRAVPRGADTEHASAHAAETAFVAAPAALGTAAPEAVRPAATAAPAMVAAPAATQLGRGPVRSVVPLRRTVPSVAPAVPSVPVDAALPLPSPSSPQVVGPGEGAPVKTRPNLPEKPDF